MMHSNKKLLVVITILVTLLVSMACAQLSELTGQEEEIVPTEPPPPTEVPEPTVEQAPVERVQLDPCTLLTEEEVGAVLGGPVETQPPMGTGGCVYLMQTDDPADMRQLAVSAAQGNEAKAFTVLSMGMLAGFSGDPEIQAGFEEVNTQVPDLTLMETVSRLAALFRGTGVSVIETDGPGEHATWMAYEDEFYSQGTLILVRGEEYVSITQIGGDMAVAFDALANLGGTVFDRLPESFYTMDEDGDGSFTFSLGEEEEPPPTDTPEPTLTPEPTEPPTQGCVPELVSPFPLVIMDNGCTNHTDPKVWDFEWSECPGAQSYHLYVIGANAIYPFIDLEIPNTSYRSEGTGYVADQNRTGWKWKVRAMQNGVWGEWSPVRTFDVERLDTDCP